jgi:hypothetical protein
MNFNKFFLLFWVIFALLDPDPDSESGSGSTDPIESGSNPDPDPQPCLKRRTKIGLEIQSFTHPHKLQASCSQIPQNYVVLWKKQRVWESIMTCCKERVSRTPKKARIITFFLSKAKRSHRRGVSSLSNFLPFWWGMSQQDTGTVNTTNMLPVLRIRMFDIIDSFPCPLEIRS